MVDRAAIGASPREFLYPPSGGDVPRSWSPAPASEIAAGALVGAGVGSEAQRTERNAKRAGLALDWSEDAPFGPDELGGMVPLYSPTEVAHGMRVPAVIYALFEQALRARKRLTPAQRAAELGKLCAGFATVAQGNPLAARSEGYSAEDIATASPKNRYVGFPYTRLMTANVYVDQGAAIIVCSQARADEWGVPQDRRVYLHGSAHGHDEWFATERSHLDRSPAINRVVRDTLDGAGITVDQVSHFDLYGCFASAVEVACDEIGIATDDPRGLTVTGGLSFFGGPGNNYVSHSIAEWSIGSASGRQRPGHRERRIAHQARPASIRRRGPRRRGAPRTTRGCRARSMPRRVPRFTSTPRRRARRRSRAIRCSTGRTVRSAASSWEGWSKAAAASSPTRRPTAPRC